MTIPRATTPVALIVGAGGALGDALCDEFLDSSYRVIGLRRPNSSNSRSTVRYLSTDLQDPMDVQRAALEAAAQFGHVDVVICNAAHFRQAPFEQLKIQDFTACWQAAVGAAYGALSAILPLMMNRQRGTVIVSGATGSLRGTSGFAAFASAKFALRGFAQSLAREYHPFGIHVAHVVIDGILRGSTSAQRFAKRDDLCIDPRSAATLYRQIAEQPANAWTHELDLRPLGERF